jgi:hypothetical protein
MSEPSQVQNNESQPETTGTGTGKVSNAGIFVSYRIPPSDYAAMELIAKHLHAMGTIRQPTVSALAKACLYTQCNLFTLIEQQNQSAMEYDKRMKELQESIARNRVPTYQKTAPTPI